MRTILIALIVSLFAMNSAVFADDAAAPKPKTHKKTAAKATMKKKAKKNKVTNPSETAPATTGAENPNPNPQ